MKILVIVIVVLILFMALVAFIVSAIIGKALGCVLTFGKGSGCKKETFGTFEKIVQPFPVKKVHHVIEKSVDECDVSACDTKDEEKCCSSEL